MSSRAAARCTSAPMEGAAGAGRGKPEAAQARAGKHVALADVTNIVGTGRFGAADAKLSSTKSIIDVKKAWHFWGLRNVNTQRGSVANSASIKLNRAETQHDSALQGVDVSRPSAPTIVLTGGSSPGLSEDSVIMEDAMSTCHSTESPDIECLDDGDDSLAASLHCWANDKLHISDMFNWRKQNPFPMKTENIRDLDNHYEDPQLCAALAHDIYKNLREAETRKRPSTNYLEITQTSISASMRAVLIDWLVDVTEEYRLVPETLYLAVNYIDRYLSVKKISWRKLQLLGVACLLIAAKYEEICPPQIEELCYLTDYSYTKDEVLHMEASVLGYLKFELTAPTAKCFLRRFLRAAQVCDEGPTLDLEFIANYICELSLLEYSLICCVPSLVAASSVFLAKFILKSTKNPWNSTLSYYTQYTPSKLCGCVRVLHRLFRVGPGSNLPAVREKYSQHKYKFVAKKYCPPSIPIEFFQDTNI